MRVKVQVDEDSAFASVRRLSDHALVGDVEELRKKKPVSLEVADDEYVQVTEDPQPEHLPSENEDQDTKHRFPGFSEPDEDD